MRWETSLAYTSQCQAELYSETLFKEEREKQEKKFYVQYPVPQKKGWNKKGSWVQVNVPIVPVTEAEDGLSPGIQEYPGQFSETPFLKQNKNGLNVKF